MARHTTIGVLTRTGIDEISIRRPPRTKGAMLVGFITGVGADETQRAAARERRAIARAYSQLGYDVFMSQYDPMRRRSPTNRLAYGWANDLYITANGVVIPAEGPFALLGQGGFYVFGEDFVLVSKQIEDAFRRQRRNHAGFARAFDNRAVHFVEPFVLRLRTRAKVKRLNLGGHIDLTIGYIPRQRVLTIADLHYAEVENEIVAIARRHGLAIRPTTIDPAFSYHAFVNNYFVLEPGRPNQVVVANRYEGFAADLRTTGAQVRSPRIAATHLSIYRGSIKCVSNYAPSPDLFDRLGIAHQRFRPRIPKH